VIFWPGAYERNHRKEAKWSALDGTTISEGSFEHLYRFRGGLIVRMDIQNVEAFSR